jgi:hypothetical protein
MSHFIVGLHRSQSICRVYRQVNRLIDRMNSYLYERFTFNEIEENIACRKNRDEYEKNSTYRSIVRSFAIDFVLDRRSTIIHVRTSRYQRFSF